MGRKNNKQRTIIDVAIVLHDTGERDRAIEMLLKHEVPDAIIGRVLYEPEKRRQYVNELIEKTINKSNAGVV